MISLLSLLKRTFKEPRDVVSILLLMVGFLFLLVEIARIWPIRVPSRLINVSLAGALFYLGLRIKSSVDLRYYIPTVLGSLLFPPLLLLSFVSAMSRGGDGRGASQQDQPDLLSLSFRSVLVVCESIGLASSLAVSMASLLSANRRVVLVDWLGDAVERLKDAEVKIARPEELWFGHAGSLGPSYYMTASLLLSYMSGVNPSLIAEVLKTGDTSLLEDVRIPEPGRSLLLQLFGEGGSPLHEALPEVAGVLIIDASRLSAAGKDAISLMVLLQSAAYERRDFVVIAPLLSPLTEERVPHQIRDEIRWLVSSLGKGGAVITSIEDSLVYSNEFDFVLACDECENPTYRLDSYRLCPSPNRRARRGV